MPGSENLLVAHDSGFVGSGVVLDSVLDFEFVKVCGIGISEFLFGCGQRPC